MSVTKLCWLVINRFRCLERSTFLQVVVGISVGPNSSRTQAFYLFSGPKNQKSQVAAIDEWQQGRPPPPPPPFHQTSCHRATSLKPLNASVITTDFNFWVIISVFLSLHPFDQEYQVYLQFE